MSFAALSDRWNDSLRTLDPDKVVANCASDGVLRATVSNKPRTNPAEIRDYFVKFLARYTYVYEWQNGSWLIAHRAAGALAALKFQQFAGPLRISDPRRHSAEPICPVGVT